MYAYIHKYGSIHIYICIRIYVCVRMDKYVLFYSVLQSHNHSRSQAKESDKDRHRDEDAARRTCKGTGVDRGQTYTQVPTLASSSIRAALTPQITFGSPQAFQAHVAPGPSKAWLTDTCALRPTAAQASTCNIPSAVHVAELAEVVCVTPVACFTNPSHRALALAVRAAAPII